MSNKTKLACKRFIIRQLRKLLDAADEWLHHKEVSLREQLQGISRSKFRRIPKRLPQTQII